MFSLPNSRSFKLGVFVAILEALSAIGLIATSAFLISRASEQPPILYLMMAVVGVRAFALGRAFFRYVQRLALHDATFTHVAKLRPLVFEKHAALAPSKEAGASGEQLARAVDQVDELQNYPIRVFAPLLQAVAAMLGTSLVVGLWFPEGALSIAVVAVVSFLASSALSRSLTAKSESLRNKLNTEMRSELVEYIQAAELIDAYGWGQRYRARISELGNQLDEIDSRAAWGLGVTSSLFSFFAVVAASLSGFFASQRLDEVPGFLLAVAVLTPLALFEFLAMAGNTHASKSRFEAARRDLTSLMEANLPEHLDVTDGDVELSEFKELFVTGFVRLENRVVKVRDFAIGSGELVAVTGESGVGKSTLGYVISSLYQIKGTFEINGLSASNYDLKSRRSAIAFCEQQPQLFPGTISANLAISGVEDIALQNAVFKKLGLADELSHRGGLGLELGERGSGLSGGQAQRVAIARALLAGAKVLVLDEPTSGLDWDNSLKLMSVLKELSGSGIGIVLITHDAQLVKLADREFRLN